MKEYKCEYQILPNVFAEVKNDVITLIRGDYTDKKGAKRKATLLTKYNGDNWIVKDLLSDNTHYLNQTNLLTRLNNKITPIIFNLETPPKNKRIRIHAKNGDLVTIKRCDFKDLIKSQSRKK